MYNLKLSITGVYYSPFTNLKVASKRSTVQTLALIYPKDVEEHGLGRCLEKVIFDLKELVIHGLFDEKSGKTLQIRVICNLGDNLGK